MEPWPSWPHICPHGSVCLWWKGQWARARGGTRHLPWAGQTWPRRGKDRARGGPRRACRARGHAVWARGPGPGDTQVCRPGSRGSEDLCPPHMPAQAKLALATPHPHGLSGGGWPRPDCPGRVSGRQGGARRQPASPCPVSGHAGCLQAPGDETRGRRGPVPEPTGTLDPAARGRDRGTHRGKPHAHGNGPLSQPP